MKDPNVNIIFYAGSRPLKIGVSSFKMVNNEKSEGILFSQTVKAEEQGYSTFVINSNFCRFELG